ncbi:flippase [Pseudoalteromonas sp. NSLLW24]|uniref:flippase n=1 Tax=Pseudoalteromonas sp. NSLLW24 TaxID=2792050 RepID=UPI001A2C1228|nr:flippase [Pseudoalteromonas sp. NSLLW24]MBG9999210.1 flippase [Pseudoalteromonas sp. NSLLW24]
MLTTTKLKNIVFNVVYYLLNVLFPIITYPYITRMLGVENVGTANLVITVSTYFATLASLGIPIYGIREIAKCKGNDKQRDFVVSELLFLNLIAVSISLVLYFITIHNVSFMEDNIVLYYFAGVNVALSLFQIDWFFQGTERFKILAIRNLIVKALSVVLIFLLVDSDDDTDMFVITTVIALTLTNVINIISLLRCVSLKYSNLNLKKHLKPILFFSGTRLVSTIYTLLDSVLLAILSSNYFVGLYTTAIKLIRVLTTAISSVSLVFFADTARLANSSQDEYTANLTSLLMFLLLLVCPSVLFFFVFSYEIITVFAGESFSGAAFTLRILSILIFVSMATNFIGMQILYAKNHERFVFISLSIGACVCVISNLILIPLAKHNGAAISAVLTEFSILMFQVFIVYKNKLISFKNIKYKILKILSINVLFIVFIFIVYLLFKGIDTMWMLILLSTLSLFSYPIFLIIFKESTFCAIKSRFLK